MVYEIDAWSHSPEQAVSLMPGLAEQIEQACSFEDQAAIAACGELLEACGVAYDALGTAVAELGDLSCELTPGMEQERGEALGI